MVPQPRQPVTFELSDPPASTPVRSASGAPIKAKVIRAMETQFRAEQSASVALDAMIRLLRRLSDTPPPRVAPDEAEAV
jgi:hypothetical protein